jgi:glucokinase
VWELLSPAELPVSALAEIADAAAAPWPRLVADVGGTNARFAWLQGPGSAPEHLRTLAVAGHPSLAVAATEYLKGLPPGPSVQAPQACAVAVATAVTGDEVAFTNSAWSFSIQALRYALGVQRLRVLNDFEALALALPHLAPQAWAPLGPWSQPAPQHGAFAVVGPGTGLGVAGLVRTAAGWQAIAGEGGHATLAAADDYEAELLRCARQRLAHVSAERLLSGIGLPLLYEVVAQVQGQAGVPALTAPQIVDSACAPEPDALCGLTMDAFCALLGGFAGNVALTYGARSGVFIAGGILPRLGAARIERTAFRARFEAKGRFGLYLQAVPSLLLLDTMAALTGAAAALDGA